MGSFENDARIIRTVEKGDFRLFRRNWWINNSDTLRVAELFGYLAIFQSDKSLSWQRRINNHGVSRLAGIRHIIPVLQNFGFIGNQVNRNRIDQFRCERSRLRARNVRVQFPEISCRAEIKAGVSRFVNNKSPPEKVPLDAQCSWFITNALLRYLRQSVTM